jgi:hypothetical protein
MKHIVQIPFLEKKIVVACFRASIIVGNFVDYFVNFSKIKGFISGRWNILLVPLTTHCGRFQVFCSCYSDAADSSAQTRNM